MKILNKQRKKNQSQYMVKKLADQSMVEVACMVKKNLAIIQKNVAKAIYSMSLLRYLAAISVGNSKMFCRTWGLA